MPKAKKVTLVCGSCGKRKSATKPASRKKPFIDQDEFLEECLVLAYKAIRQWDTNGTIISKYDGEGAVEKFNASVGIEFMELAKRNIIPFGKEGNMSLDVWLEQGETEKVCDHCGSTYKTKTMVFESNITHNLTKMAAAAGIYRACWRPAEIGVTKAKDIIPLLKEGLDMLEAAPEHFKQFDAANGWGTYEQFVPWVKKYLIACEKYPDAEINASR